MRCTSLEVQKARLTYLLLQALALIMSCSPQLSPVMAAFSLSFADLPVCSAFSITLVPAVAACWVGFCFGYYLKQKQIVNRFCRWVMNILLLNRKCLW